MITKNPETFTVTVDDFMDDEDAEILATRSELETLRSQIDLAIGPSRPLSPAKTPLTLEELERFVSGLPSAALPVSYEDRFMLYWVLGSKINCIKMLRESFGLGLKHAKDMYEYMDRERGPDVPMVRHVPFRMENLRKMADEAMDGKLAVVTYNMP